MAQIHNDESLAIDKARLAAREKWKTRIADAKNQIAGVLIVEAADITTAASLFLDHPHITIFPGDGIDIMPALTGPPEDQPS